MDKETVTEALEYAGCDIEKDIIEFIDGAIPEGRSAVFLRFFVVGKIGSCYVAYRDGDSYLMVVRVIAGVAKQEKCYEGDPYAAAADIYSTYGEIT